MINYLCIIQARLGSTRFPNKVMQTVKGRTLLKRVWDAAKGCKLIDKVIVAWPERYPDLDENDVLGRFQRISNEFPSKYIIRLTSDCPLLITQDIDKAIEEHNDLIDKNYYSNHYDGHDVQIFKSELLYAPWFTHKEHVVKDFTTLSTGLSVNTKEDLNKVRLLAK